MMFPGPTVHMPKRLRNSGFTLIELMIAVAIVGMLVAIALPSYRAYIIRGDRAVARAALLDAQQFMERYNAVNNGFTGAVLPSRLTSVPPEAPRYGIALSTVTPVTANTYLLEATPNRTDALCGVLTIKHTGEKGNGGTGSTADCWK